MKTTCSYHSPVQVTKNLHRHRRERDRAFCRLDRRTKRCVTSLPSSFACLMPCAIYDVAAIKINWRTPAWLNVGIVDDSVLWFARLRQMVPLSMVSFACLRIKLKAGAASNISSSSIATVHSNERIYVTVQRWRISVLFYPIMCYYLYRQGSISSLFRVLLLWHSNCPLNSP